MAMQTKLRATSPREIYFTMEITMTLGEWKSLEEQLITNAHPSFRLSREIRSLVEQASKSYLSEVKDA